jgi:hypothetical protein
VKAQVLGTWTFPDKVKMTKHLSGLVLQREEREQCGQKLSAGQE